MFQWSLSEDQKRMTLRYVLGVFLGTLGILFLQSYFQSNYDSVASVALFSCIIAVTGEDQSLGPVISKSLFRILGVFIGGICGYIFLYLPTNLFSKSKIECLLLIPAIFCGFIQWITKGGMPSLTKLIKTKKATHLLIQIQVAFGIIYVGSWDALDRGFLIAACRTCAILYGCVALLIASLISYPQTSMHVCNIEIATCLRSVGKLFVAICNDRVECVGLGPYDHRGKIFAKMYSPDDHMKIIEAIDVKLARVSSLLPFLYLEPSWVPGLPIQLIGTERYLSSNWGLLIGVLHSRLTRIRSTLITMDSNSRLTRDMKSNKINQDICIKMKKITEHITHSFNLMATYLESPYLTTCGWKGNLKLRKDFITETEILKKEIEIFSMLITKKIIETLDAKRSWYDVHQEAAAEAEGEGGGQGGRQRQGGGQRQGGEGGDGQGGEGDFMKMMAALSAHEENLELEQEEQEREAIDKKCLEEKSHLPRQRKGISSGDSSNGSRNGIPYRERSSVVMRDRVGMTLDYYHRLYPNKTFCNLAIQVCLQTISFHREVVDFIDSIVEEGEGWSHPDGYRSVAEKDKDKETLNLHSEKEKGQDNSLTEQQSQQQQQPQIELSSVTSLSRTTDTDSVLEAMDNPLLSHYV